MPQLLPWLASRTPEVVCLQETKTEDASFPVEEVRAAGYQALFIGQKAYNGVAILSRTAATDVITAVPGFADEQKRVAAATIDGIRVICIYVPNGESIESDKYRYKLRWLDALHDWLQGELQRWPQLALLGDFNIAPEDRDVFDPRLWQGKVLFSEPEKERFRRLLELGLKDSFRLFEQPPRSYTWWDYRMNQFKRNMGLRIDHILVSQALAARCTACVIDRDMRAQERPSDHAPVTLVMTREASS